SIANSGNDVLRLTGGSPFASALSSGNAVNIYFTPGALALGTLSGGFYTGTQADFLSSISGATFNYFVQDSGGAYSYNGQAYKTLADFSPGTTVNLTTIAAGSGQAVQFAVVPEPSTIGLAAAGLGLAGLMRWRMRAAARVAA
ncbi:MAG: PEP-CTERM sorting domain-containing protein, partial [Planctomycetia bacterium]|nr:PEP-CTERM sorting domain-containing protein [Planctomycetia bacterium]